MVRKYNGLNRFPIVGRFIIVGGTLSKNLVDIELTESTHSGFSGGHSYSLSSKEAINAELLFGLTISIGGLPQIVIKGL